MDPSVRFVYRPIVFKIATKNLSFLSKIGCLKESILRASFKLSSHIEGQAVFPRDRISGYWEDESSTIF